MYSQDTKVKYVKAEQMINYIQQNFETEWVVVNYTQ
jgi:hypothetical protein